MYKLYLEESLKHSTAIKILENSHTVIISWREEEQAFIKIK